MRVKLTRGTGWRADDRKTSKDKNPPNSFGGFFCLCNESESVLVENQ